ncbi:sensor histidine kinase [Desertimonas flava]|uniref:sensor histidine kinase n=1 Tax=Desertimonas flava TaxID=2064846 RepID=UPI000E35623B|nr:sensor histidine kinase [Desertimonas flava]
MSSIVPWRDWRLARWMREHPFLVDGALAAGVASIALVSHFLQDETDGRQFRDPSWWTVPLVVVACVPLAWRRRHTIVSALLTVGLQIVLDFAGISGPAWVGVAMSLYALGSHASGAARVRATVIITAAITAILVLSLLLDLDGITVGDAIGVAALMAVCFLVGELMRRRRNEIAELAARADRAEHERELVVGQRLAEERTRIARDLHDVVAHSVSVMVIQATAASRNLERNPSATAELLANIESTGRQTMGELRQILGVLRDPAVGDTPVRTPVLTDIDALVQSVPELDVRLVRSGSFDDVPTGVALSAFRVVQEALTNVTRHAGPNVTVEVIVDCTPERVNVSVADDGRGASAQPSAEGSGYGLIGMSERVAAFGGQLRTGPRRDGGWEVRAHFPLAAADRQAPPTDARDDSGRRQNSGQAAMSPLVGWHR